MASLLMLFVVFPLIAVTRNISGSERISLSFLSDAFSSIDNPVLSIISEIGSSMSTVGYTLEYIPNTRNYDFGFSYVYALLTLFPNLFWDIHPTIAHGTPSNWLIWLVDPYTASRGGGLGYSFIAEAYFNFGWLGTPITLATIGLLYSKFVLWAYHSKDPAKLAMVACYSTIFTFYAREDAALIVRSLVWYSLGPYILVLLVSQLRRSRLSLSSGSRFSLHQRG